MVQQPFSMVQSLQSPFVSCLNHLKQHHFHAEALQVLGLEMTTIHQQTSQWLVQSPTSLATEGSHNFPHSSPKRNQRIDRAKHRYMIRNTMYRKLEKHLDTSRNYMNNYGFHIQKQRKQQKELAISISPCGQVALGILTTAR